MRFACSLICEISPTICWSCYDSRSAAPCMMHADETYLRVSFCSFSFRLFVLGVELRFRPSCFLQINGIDFNFELVNLSFCFAVEDVVVNVLSSLVTRGEIIPKVGYVLLEVRDIAVQLRQLFFQITDNSLAIF